MAKVIINKEQHLLIINEIIKEMSNIETINEEIISEGIWEKIKYNLSKLGRYKAGGKILGKGQIDADAKAKIEAILDKKGNEVIKNLDNTVKTSNPEFPNNEKGTEFLSTIMSISAVYDSIIAATQKNQEDKDYLPIDAANSIINDLREYVKKFLDIDLTAAYSVVDEAEGNTLNISEEELNKFNEHWNSIEEAAYIEKPEDRSRKEFDRGGAHVVIPKENPTNSNTDTDLDAGDVRKSLQAKRGGGPEFDSERMKTLKSNKLPAMMASVGSALGGLSWLVNTAWFKHLFDTTITQTDPVTIKNTIEQQTQIFRQIKPNEGVYKFVGHFTGHHLDAHSKPSDFINALKQISGSNDPHKGVELLCQKGGIMMRPDEAKAGLDQFLANPNKYHNLNDLFSHDAATGTGKLGPVDTTLYGTKVGTNMSGFITQVLIKTVTKFITTTTVKTGAGYLVAKGLGSVLGPIGITLIASGALVKLMRMKGQKQSRAKTLNDLYQSIRNIEGGAIVEPEGEVINSKEAQNPETIDNKNTETKNVPRGTNAEKGGPTDNSDLYNSIKNLFKFVVSNKEKVGNIVYGGKSFNQGDKVTWTNKNGKKIEAVVVGKSKNPDDTIVQISGQQGTTAVSTDKLNALSENILNEAKYFKDVQTYKILTQQFGGSDTMIKSFEELLYMVQMLIYKISKFETNDKILLDKLNQLKRNPIMVTNFQKMFNIPSDNTKLTESLKSFIVNILKTIYSGNFKYGNMIDKLIKLGGDIEKLEEADNRNQEFIKSGQDRGKFKTNLLNFMVSLIGIFQYLNKIQNNQTNNKTNNKQSKGDLKYNNQKVTLVQPPNIELEPGNVEIRLPNGNETQVKKDEVDNLQEIKRINEEIKRIKNLMLIK
jgi:hypothetical protein